MAIRISKWILCSCLAAVFSFLKSILFRKSGKEKTGLPTSKRQRPDGQEDVHDTEEEQLQNWDSWEDGGMTGVTVDSGGLPEDANMEPDFFSDMAPSFKKAALIRKKANQQPSKGSYTPSSTGGMLNRLTMGVDDTATLTGELGAWTDSGRGWEDGAVDDDLVQEADSVVREKREEERRKKMVEQQKKKADRDAQRASQKGPSKLAVKLS